MSWAKALFTSAGHTSSIGGHSRVVVVNGKKRIRAVNSS